MHSINLERCLVLKLKVSKDNPHVSNAMIKMPLLKEPHD